MQSGPPLLDHAESADAGSEARPARAEDRWAKDRQRDGLAVDGPRDGHAEDRQQDWAEVRDQGSSTEDGEQDRLSERQSHPGEGGPEDLIGALQSLRRVIEVAHFPLDVPGTPDAIKAARALAAQLDDYLVPRVRDLDAPLLAVVGGSTGVGKSTLVNSLVRVPVSPAGILRPTTRGAVLVCHPDDGASLAQRQLPVTNVASAPRLTPGLALLDAPDLDSVVAANRALADELLAAADLWLFVTTAARYADAVPWAALRGARDRGTAVAVVLDRVPPPVRDDVTSDFARLLHEGGLGDAPLFVINESTRDGHGLLSEAEVEPVREFLAGIATSPSRRRSVTRGTLLGAVAAAADRADDLATVAGHQADAAASLARTIRLGYSHATSLVEGRIEAGDMLRGQVYARWRELVDSGEARQVLRVARDPSRARVDVPPPGRALLGAVSATLVEWLAEADRAAMEWIERNCRVDSAVRDLLAGGAAVGAGAGEGARMGAGLADELVQDWQSWLRTAARAQAPRVRTATRGRSTAVLVLLATVAAVTAPDAVNDRQRSTGSAAAALAELHANRAVAELGERARAELLARMAGLFVVWAGCRLGEIESWGVDAGLPERLRDAGERVRIARQLSLVLAA